MPITDTDLIRFAADLRQDVISMAELEGDEALRSDAFTQRMISDLTEFGELDDGEACYHRDRGIEISGYAVGGNDEDELALFSTVYLSQAPPPTVGRQDIRTQFKRLVTFVDRAIAGYHHQLEEASPQFDMALRIYDLRHQIQRLRLFLFTDGLAVTGFKGAEVLEVGDRAVPVGYQIWDLRRLHRASTSGRRQESIEIDFQERFGSAIPCLLGPETDGYASYLAILTGDILSTIYDEYGPRVLELNVRSFLQARGKVNAGLRETILKQPERVFAYNNGISATASAIKIVDLPGGGKGIRNVRDFQIVNGGQTTASIHHAKKVDGADVSALRVQAKLTVVGDAGLKVLVPLIARFANTQNPIKEADFSANDQFHVRLEELSRTVWAPPANGTQRQTRWFYERARGQYQDALAREGTSAKRAQFKVTHPLAQKFTKTDLAKVENTWSQLPHLVSTGAEKNFREFTLRKPGGDPDQTYFQRLVAKTVLFRRAEKIISARHYGGYRANIVTYTLAYLSHETTGRLDLDHVWRTQDIGIGLANAIDMVSIAVQAKLVRPPGGKNVTEWCKRSGCWDAVRSLRIKLPPELKPELLQSALSESANGHHSLSEADRALVAHVESLSGEGWLRLSRWAKETTGLESWQRSIAYTIAKQMLLGVATTPTQATRAARMLEDARRLGFRVG